MSPPRRVKPVWASVTRGIRDELGLSQEYVANAAGISQGYISQLEMGDVRHPSVDMVARLAHAYGMPLHYLLRRAGYDCGCGQYRGDLLQAEEGQDVMPSGQ